MVEVVGHDGDCMDRGCQGVDIALMDRFTSTLRAAQG